MDNTRLILVMSLVMIATLLWQEWQRDYGPQPIAAPTSEGDAAPLAIDDLPPAAVVDDALAPTVSSAPYAQATASSDNPDLTSSGSLRPIRVTTDVFNIEVSPRGGGIRRVELIKYPVALDSPDQPFVLMDDSKDLYFVAEGGLSSKSGVDAPNHNAIYTASSPSYIMAEGDNELEVRLLWRSEAGVEVTKVLQFTRGSYLITTRYEITNRSTTTWPTRAYQQLQRRWTKGRKGVVYTFTGIALSSPEKRYDKVSFDDLVDEPLAGEVTDGWLAVLQHYFVVAELPPRGETFTYDSKAYPDRDVYLARQSGPTVQVAPGQTTTLSLQTYVGPKLQQQLAEIAPGLDLTIDYGVLWFIAKPLFWLLNKIHGLTGNWGWGIIILTIIVKACFFHLSALGYRSMARMRKVQPRMVQIKERYGDDRQRMNQAMMELYKTEKINPLSGCFPILVQIPVFIALYWVLLESVELRQAPFMFWIHDLANKDPYFVLPLIMGISMFAQQKLNPAPMDPIQQKVMQILPFAFTIFFAFFPAGLVLYWVVNNVLSISQQWYITRAIEKGAPAPA